MLVFITGASGFLGLHVVNQLLEAGHSVKGSARGEKYERLKRAFADVPSFEAVEIAEIGSGDLTQVLKGVDAIIHTAAPLAGRVSFDEGKRYTAEGAVHILREGYKVGVRRAVVTSSIAAYPNGSNKGPYGPNDFCAITEEVAKSTGPPYGAFGAYIYQKTYAEQAVIAFAKEHPDIDIILPGPAWLFGPLAPQFTQINPTQDISALATQAYFYSLLDPKGSQFPFAPGGADVRDAARVHVLGLHSSTASGTNWHRFVVAARVPYSWKEAIQILKENRPELQARLADPAAVPDWVQEGNKVNLTAEEEDVKDVLLGREGNIGDKTWKETVLEGVDSLLEVERAWAKASH
ncbi:NAD(P)-binding protein [Cylindrobasidium torrendii FP15055 ss-10]|uniref:NAD(P)-binding protein n=1 Tax=Cylindrobasidium torrendii FP15055 ss-10 TaxID=1314674 RepID=A0A0D7BS79_9AGAR|nr:NAD(P)-binding protein [Cylindrobasidium torrendii FP15055 ss-10]